MKQYAWLRTCWANDFVPYSDYWKFSENEHPVADKSKFSWDLARLCTGVMKSKEDEERK